MFATIPRFCCTRARNWRLASPSLRARVNVPAACARGPAPPWRPPHAFKSPAPGATAEVEPPHRVQGLGGEHPVADRECDLVAPLAQVARPHRLVAVTHENGEAAQRLRAHRGLARLLRRRDS